LVKNLVSCGGHALQRDAMTEAFQQVFDVVGLPKGKSALSRGNGQF
jgi:hypothetical protein